MSERNEEMVQIAAETREIWDANAAFWSDAMGDGNSFHLHLVAPAVERLLAVKPGQRILDLACGSGHFSRRLVELGATVVAADFSSVFLDKARERLRPLGDRVQFQQVDATVPAQLAQLAERGPFDAIVANMALMDIPTLEPMAAGLGPLLARGGAFVFSVSHPCFNMAKGCTMVAEEEDRDGEFITHRYLKISRYRQPLRTKGIGISGQPRAQLYFHRSLTDLLSPFLAAGFAVDGIEEPTFPAEVTSDAMFAWESYREIPPVFAARLRLR